MKTNAKSTLSFFESCLSQLESKIADFSANPNKDFTRHRLLDLKTVIRTLMSFCGKSTDNELIDLFSQSDHIPSESALIQQRNKLHYEALHYLLLLFQKPPTEDQLFKGFRLLAVDGSGLEIASNENDPDSRHQGIGAKAPFNEVFVHGLFDVYQQTYVDFRITKLHKNNEPRVFVNMIQDYQPLCPTIFLGDANYSTYNIMAHIHKSGQKFLLRAKDVTSNGLVSAFQLPDSDTFDITLPDLVLTRLCSEQNNPDRNSVHFLARACVFDFLSTRTKENDEQYFPLPLRIVRFKIADDKYETIVTNLDPVDFPPLLIKQLYTLRWGIETSYRRLKHTIGMIYTHSKKADFIFQEIYAKAIMFNFVALCTASIVLQKGEKGISYTVNFSTATNLCKKFFHGTIDLLKLEDNIFRRMNPIRPSQSFERNKHRCENFKSFMYRVA